MTNNEQQNKSATNFEILEELINKNKKKLKIILEKNKSLIQNAENFDSAIQNLNLLQTILKKGNNSFYLQKLEKNDISIQELINSLNSKEEDFIVLNAFYITCNYVFFSKLNRNKTSFNEERLDDLKLSLEDGYFINSKFNKMPSFPFLKLWLSQMNFYFNNQKKIDFFKNIANFHKIQLIIKNFGKQDKKNNKPYHNYFFISLIYGSFFYNLSHMEQNNFSKDEFEIIFLILNIMKEGLFKDKTSFENKLKRLKQKIKDFKETSNLIDYNKNSIRNSISTDLLPLLPKKEKGYDKTIFNKLIKHLEILTLFFEIYHNIFFLKDHKKALQLIFDNRLFDKKKNKFKNMYSLSFFNLIGIINFREENYIMANNCFSKGICDLEKPEIKQKIKNEEKKRNNILEIKKSNNLFQSVNLFYNTAMCHYKLGDYDKCVKILNSLQNNFKKNHIFWYRLGICNYKLFKLEITKLSENLYAKHKSFIHEDKKKYSFSNLKIYTLYCQNVMEEFNLQKKKIKKNDNKENKLSRTNNLDNAILAFFNCFLLIRNLEEENDIKKNFECLKKKKIDSLMKSYVKNLKEMERYYYSSLENMIFLYIVSKQELKADYFLKRAFLVKNLTEKQKNKLFIYKSIVESKLQNYKKSLESLEKIKISNNIDKKKNNYKCNFFLGKENKFKENLQDLLNYNKLLIFYLKKDNEGFIKKLTSSEIRDKIFDFNDQGDPKIYEKLLFWSFYSTREFNLCQIKSVVNSVYPKENIF